MKKILTSLLVLFFINSSLLAEECLIMKGDDVDPEEFSEILGKKVLFCCGSCVKAFDGAQAYYIKAVPGLAKMFTEEEMKKLGVDKVKLLAQTYCPIYPDRIINPNSKTVVYKGKTIYLWSSSAQRRWKRDPDAYFKEAFEKGLLPQYKS
jgi:YHS domain-containing protein